MQLYLQHIRHNNTPSQNKRKSITLILKFVKYYNFRILWYKIRNMQRHFVIIEKGWDTPIFVTSGWFFLRGYDLAFYLNFILESSYSSCWYIFTTGRFPKKSSSYCAVLCIFTPHFLGYRPAYYNKLHSNPIRRLAELLKITYSLHPPHFMGSEHSFTGK